MKNRTVLALTSLAFIVASCGEGPTETGPTQTEELGSMRAVAKQDLTGHVVWRIQGREQGSVFVEELVLPGEFQHELVFDPESSCGEHIQDCTEFSSHKATVERSPLVIEIDHHTSRPDYRMRPAEGLEVERRPSYWAEHELMVWAEYEDAITLRAALAPCTTSRDASRVEVVELVRDNATLALELLRLEADFPCDDGTIASGVEFQLERHKGGGWQWWDAPSSSTHKKP